MALGRERGCGFFNLYFGFVPFCGLPLFPTTCHSSPIVYPMLTPVNTKTLKFLRVFVDNFPPKFWLILGLGNVWLGTINGLGYFYWLA